MEQGVLDEIRMNSLRFRYVVSDIMHYVCNTDFLTRYGDVSLLYRVAASLEECLIVSARVQGDREREAHARECRQALDSIVRDYPIRGEDCSFLQGQQRSTLPEWKGLPVVLKRLIFDLCAVQNNNNISFLHQHSKLSKIRYMDADSMIDEDDDKDASGGDSFIEQTSNSVPAS
ncbi:hypothetical protein Btru_014201 [Bulinus truncatus]|nr:hypothetical protein Btru_014201 [Bulinus truncatus]